MKEIALYGTSDKRLDISRGLQKIRDFMVPETFVKEKAPYNSNFYQCHPPDRFMIDNESLVK